jgi:hypothetical protein
LVVRGFVVNFEIVVVVIEILVVIVIVVIKIVVVADIIMIVMGFPRIFGNRVKFYLINLTLLNLLLLLAKQIFLLLLIMYVDNFC